MSLLHLLTLYISAVELCGPAVPHRRFPPSRYSFVLVNVKHMKSLGLRSLKEVSAGKVMLKGSPELCYIQTVNWSRLFRSEEQELFDDTKCSES